MTRTWTCPVCELGGDACACGVDKRPGVCGGRWVVRGTRIWVATVANVQGAAADLYPQLEPEQVAAVLRWIDGGGSRALASEEFYAAWDEVARSTRLARLARLTRAQGHDEAFFRGLMDGVASVMWAASAPDGDDSSTGVKS